MDQKSATQPETPQTPDEAWRRFTLLDLLILFSGHEAALGLMKWYGALDDIGRIRSHFVDQLVPLLIIFLMLGGILSIPWILLVQYYSRHRRTRIAAGEIHAIMNPLYWLFLLPSYLFHMTDFYGLILIIVSVPMGLFCFFGGVMFFHDHFSTKKTVLCYWLSQYGYFLSLVSALIIMSAFLATA
jgi:hypothetical protein